MADGGTRVNLGDPGGEYDPMRMRAIVRRIEQFIARIRIDGPLIIGGGAVIDKFLSASATWDPANVLNGAQTTTTVTVTGARLADASMVTVGFSKDLQGMRLTGYVSADDTVTVVLRNDTGGAINLASGTLRVGVFKV